MTMDLSSANWVKSSYSQHGGDCIEIAHFASGAVGVRDSKDPTGPALVFTSVEWSAFTARVKAGRF